jgi:hypothetical protein
MYKMVIQLFVIFLSSIKLFGKAFDAFINIEDCVLVLILIMSFE